MKTAKILLLLVILVAIVWVAWSLNSDNSDPVACTADAKVCPDGSYVGRVGPDCEFAECPEAETGLVSGVSVAQIEREVAEGRAVLLDVRTDTEWESGHASSATHFDVTRMREGELPDLDSGLNIYTYCAAGVRAGEAKDILEASGYGNVVNIGGFIDWVEAGGETEGL